jgi:hypothetical protein
MANWKNKRFFYSFIYLFIYLFYLLYFCIYLFIYLVFLRHPETLFAFEDLRINYYNNMVSRIKNSFRIWKSYKGMFIYICLCIYIVFDGFFLSFLFVFLPILI